MCSYTTKGVSESHCRSMVRICCCSRILLQLTQLLFPFQPLFLFQSSQNTEDEVLKAAIAKYGKINGTLLFPFSTSSSDNT